MPHTDHQFTTTRADTHAVTINAPREQVFAFAADPQNLPRWAVGFCHAIRRSGDAADRWMVTTGQGEVAVHFVTDAARGVIDFHLSPAPGVEVVAFSRVVPNGAGAEYIFTQLQSPGMADEVFEAQVHALVEELQVLRALIHARAACPA